MRAEFAPLALLNPLAAEPILVHSVAENDRRAGIAVFAVVLEPGLRTGGVDVGRSILAMERPAPEIRDRPIGKRHQLVVSAGGMALDESHHTILEGCRL